MALSWVEWELVAVGSVWIVTAAIPISIGPLRGVQWEIIPIGSVGVVSVSITIGIIPLRRVVDEIIHIVGITIAIRIPLTGGAPILVNSRTDGCIRTKVVGIPDSITVRIVDVSEARQIACQLCSIRRPHLCNRTVLSTRTGCVVCPGSETHRVACSRNVG